MLLKIIVTTVESEAEYQWQQKNNDNIYFLNVLRCWLIMLSNLRIDK